jgi:hypothetical protein
MPSLNLPQKLEIAKTKTEQFLLFIYFFDAQKSSHVRCTCYCFGVVPGPTENIYFLVSSLFSRHNTSNNNNHHNDAKHLLALKIT